MTRINLTEEGIATGLWFDPDKVLLFIDESTYWNGSNQISRSTGSQFEHEGIYFTKSKQFVIYKHSDYQGSPSVFEKIDTDEVVAFIIRNEFDDDQLKKYFKLLPENVKELVFSNLESREI